MMPHVMRVQHMLEVARARRALEVESDAVQLFAERVDGLAVDLVERQAGGLSTQRDEVLLRLQDGVVEGGLWGREDVIRWECACLTVRERACGERRGGLRTDVRDIPTTPYQLGAAWWQWRKDGLIFAACVYENQLVVTDYLIIRGIMNNERIGTENRC